MAYIFPEALVDFQELSLLQQNQILAANKLLDNFIQQISIEIKQKLPAAEVIVGGSYAIGTHCWTFNPNLTLLSDVDLYVITKGNVDSLTQEELALRSKEFWSELMEYFVLTPNSYSAIKYINDDIINRFIEFRNIAVYDLQHGITVKSGNKIRRHKLRLFHDNNSFMEMNVSYLIYKHLVYGNCQKTSSVSEIYELAKSLWRTTHNEECGSAIGLVIEINTLKGIINKAVNNKLFNAHSTRNLDSWAFAASLITTIENKNISLNGFLAGYKNMVRDKWPSSYLNYQLSQMLS